MAPERKLPDAEVLEVDNPARCSLAGGKAPPGGVCGRDPGGRVAIDRNVLRERIKLEPGLDALGPSATPGEMNYPGFQAEPCRQRGAAATRAGSRPGSRWAAFHGS